MILILQHSQCYSTRVVTIPLIILIISSSIAYLRSESWDTRKEIVRSRNTCRGLVDLPLHESSLAWFLDLFRAQAERLRFSDLRFVGPPSRIPEDRQRDALSTAPP